jgi:predicted TIM-barrel fold metal-dependent hydrolase
VIVDAHVHLLPERLAAKIRRFFVERGAPPMPYPHDPKAGRAALAASGVGLCWSLPYAHRAGVAGPLNRWMAETFAGDPFVVPGATVHPDDDVEPVVREAIERLRLPVFKLHCSVGAFTPDDPRLDPLWERVSATCQPVVLHAGSAHDGTASSQEVDAVGRVARRWPEARIILAHFGAPSREEALRLLRNCGNLYADLCPVVATPVHPPRPAIAGLERRILFGSDVPSVAVTIEESLAAVRAWKLDPSDEDAVLGGTARALVAGVDLESAS